MNSKQLEYAIKLSKTLNFSLVAEQLNISQPALSKQILSLESELGIKLFDRTTSPMTITPAGSYFIREAQELLYKEDQLIRSMEAYKSGEAGQLTIGITPFRSSYMVSDMIKKVRAHYPHVQIRLHEAGSDILRSEVLDGKYDFAIVNLPVDDSVLDVVPLEKDQLVLSATDELIDSFEIDPTAVETNFAECKNLPFVVVGQNQEMRVLFNKLCANADFHPNIAAEVVSLTTAWSLACAGVAATLLPYQFIANKPSNNMRFININSTLYLRQPAIVIRRGQHRTAAAKYAMDVLATNSLL